MLKFMIKKGITLLETIIALSVFSVILFCVFSLQSAYISQKVFDKALGRYMECMETVSNNIVGKNSYSILQAISGAPQWYVNEENLEFEKLLSSNIIALMSDSIPDQGDYMKITVSGNEVLTIRIEIRFSVRGKVEVIQHEIYKGNYN